MTKTAVAEPKQGRAEDRVAAALAAQPDATAAELAAAAGLGQSTVGKALTGLETAKAASRRPGGRDGRRRLPDRWTGRAVAETKEPPATSGAESSGSQGGGRLRSGELRRVVAELLAGCAEPVTPTRLAKAAGGRSTGAVSNCLERLVADGVAVRVSDRPKAYLPATTPDGGPAQ